MLTTHFYPFLTIFWGAHAPIIISSFLRLFSEEQRDGEKIFRQKISSDGCEKPKAPTVALFREIFSLRLLINICIFFFSFSTFEMKMCDEGGMVGVNMWLRNERKQRVSSSLLVNELDVCENKKRKKYISNLHTYVKEMLGKLPNFHKAKLKNEISAKIDNFEMFTPQVQQQNTWDSTRVRA